jgi:hypothetical protein
VLFIFDFGIVWLEYAPVWYFLIWEWWAGRHRSSILLTEAMA